MNKYQEAANIYSGISLANKLRILELLHKEIIMTPSEVHRALPDIKYDSVRVMLRRMLKCNILCEDEEHYYSVNPHPILISAVELLSRIGKGKR